MNINKDWNMEQLKIMHESDEHWGLRRCSNQTSTVTEECVLDTFKDTSNTINDVDSSSEELSTEQFSNIIEKSITPKYQSCDKLNTKEESKINNITSCTDDPYGDIVLFERIKAKASMILKNSSKKCGFNLEWRSNKKGEFWECVVYLNSKRLASGTKWSSKGAKKEANKNALEELRKFCYTVKINWKLKSNKKIIREMPHVNDCDDDWKKSDCDVDWKKFDCDDGWKKFDCIGIRMMKMMGWMGGGLGKSEQGVMEPVNVTELKPQISRKGFGLKLDSYAIDELRAKNKMQKKLKRIQNKNERLQIKNAKKKTMEANAKRMEVNDDDWKESDCIQKKMKMTDDWTSDDFGSFWPEQDVMEPVSATLEVSREGLGLKSGSCTTDELKAKCQELFTDFLKTDIQNNIVFLDFTNDERTTIFKIAQAMRLEGRADGPKDQRKLIISRKIVRNWFFSKMKSELGKQDIVEILTATPRISRNNLRWKSDSCAIDEVKVKCQKLLLNFLNTDEQTDIIFSDFTKDERTVIHQIAQTMGLKSRIHGPIDQQEVIVSRKIVANLSSEVKSEVTEKCELGKQDIEELLTATLQPQISRKALGLNSGSCVDEVKAKCQKLLTDFLNLVDVQTNIVLLGFTDDEKMMIQNIAETMGLKSRSNKEKLIVSRTYDVQRLLGKLRSLGGIMGKYELVEPTVKRFISPSTSTSS